MILLTYKKIVPERLLQFVRAKEVGGIALFLGEVRNRSEDHSGKVRKVVSLEYSAYKEMAEKEMRNIQREILKKWKGKGLGKVAMAHRLGKLKLGETSVAIAVSAVHRKEALQACQFAIDSIKKRVPIFKKEFFAKGKAHWVGCS